MTKKKRREIYEKALDYLSDFSENACRSHLIPRYICYSFIKIGYKGSPLRLIEFMAFAPYAWRLGNSFFGEQYDGDDLLDLSFEVRQEIRENILLFCIEMTK